MQTTATNSNLHLNKGKQTNHQCHNTVRQLLDSAFCKNKNFYKLKNQN